MIFFFFWMNYLRKIIFVTKLKNGVKNDFYHENQRFYKGLNMRQNVNEILKF